VEGSGRGGGGLGEECLWRKGEGDGEGRGEWVWEGDRGVWGMRPEGGLLGGEVMGVSGFGGFGFRGFRVSGVSGGGLRGSKEGGRGLENEGARLTELL